MKEKKSKKKSVVEKAIAETHEALDALEAVQESLEVEDEEPAPPAPEPEPEPAPVPEPEPAPVNPKTAEFAKLCLTIGKSDKEIAAMLNVVPEIVMRWRTCSMPPAHALRTMNILARLAD